MWPTKKWINSRKKLIRVITANPDPEKILSVKRVVFDEKSQTAKRAPAMPMTLEMALISSSETKVSFVVSLVSVFFEKKMPIMPQSFTAIAINPKLGAEKKETLIGFGFFLIKPKICLHAPLLALVVLEA